MRTPHMHPHTRYTWIKWIEWRKVRIVHSTRSSAKQRFKITLSNGFFFLFFYIRLLIVLACVCVLSRAKNPIWRLEKCLRLLWKFTRDAHSIRSRYFKKWDFVQCIRRTNTHTRARCDHQQWKKDEKRNQNSQTNTLSEGDARHAHQRAETFQVRANTLPPLISCYFICLMLKHCALIRAFTNKLLKDVIPCIQGNAALFIGSFVAAKEMQGCSTSIDADKTNVVLLECYYQYMEVLLRWQINAEIIVCFFPFCAVRTQKDIIMQR